MWNAELGAWAAQTVLSREEAKKLLSFAKEQGFPDRERQRQWMLRLSGEFKSRAESVFEKAASEKRMVLSVSLAAGALVVVLFLVKTDHLKEGVQGLDGSWTDL